MTAKVITALKEVKNLIIFGWTQNASARDKNKQGVRINDPNAKSFCFIGTVLAINEKINISSYTYDKLIKILVKEITQIDGTNETVLNSKQLRIIKIINYNDAVERKKEDILLILDNALKTVISAK